MQVIKQTNGVQCKKQKNKLKKLFGKISLYAVSGEWIWQKFLTCYFSKACRKNLKTKRVIPFARYTQKHNGSCLQRV